MLESFERIRSRILEEREQFEHGNKVCIRIGMDTSGRASGAAEVREAVKKELARKNIEASIIQVGGLGLCYIEPLIDIAKLGRPRIFYCNVTPEIATKLVDDYIDNDNPRPDLALGTFGDRPVKGIPKLFDLPMLKPQIRLILRNCGHIDPKNINHYIINGGYSGLARALEMNPEEVIEEIKRAGLRGRGGAGFPTGLKWDICRKASGDKKYLICNADEGDPGAFMNRALLEGDPHSVLEGIVIGAHAIGASQGYIYCRAEYPLALEILKIAIKQMYEYGFLGNNILGSNFSFHLSIREGAGAFVCGEETALIASIEGRRGMPRPRPPFPATSGVWGKPTVINNVETWANVSWTLQNGWKQYVRYGTEKSRGTKTFALAGKIKRTGLIEVPFGITLREIIFDIGGGILEDKKFKAVQTGGPSGGCLPEKFLDSPIDYESLTAAGSIMGSGGMIVMDEDTCMVDIARYFLDFTRKESCGKCVMCREGIKQMHRILDDITTGKARDEDLEILSELAKAVKLGSLCGLGQTAPNPVLTTLKYFQDEYESHVLKKRCPAKVCKDLISFYILPEKCKGCGVCLRECLTGAIKGDKKMIHIIEQEKCVKCSTCLSVCPFKAVIKVSGEKVEAPDEPIPIGTWNKNKV